MKKMSHPFEFRALEFVLEAVHSFLAARTTELEIAAYPALDEFTSKIGSRDLNRVHKLKGAILAAWLTTGSSCTYILSERNPKAEVAEG